MSVMRSAVVIALLILTTGCNAADRPRDAAPRASHAGVSLLLDTTGDRATAGIAFAIEEGWHIYWRNPGDTGSAPRVTWTLPNGLAATPLRWPAPERIDSQGIVAYGYTGTVTLVAELTGGPVPAEELGAAVDFTVCRDVCVAQRVALSFPRPWPESGPISKRAVLSRLPGSTPQDWRAEMSCTPEAVTLAVHGPTTGDVDFFPNERGLFETTRPAARRSAAGVSLTITPSTYRSAPVTSIEGVLTLPERAFLLSVPVPPGRCSQTLGSPQLRKDPS